MVDLGDLLLLLTPETKQGVALLAFIVGFVAAALLLVWAMFSK